MRLKAIDIRTVYEQNDHEYYLRINDMRFNTIDIRTVYKQNDREYVIDTVNL